MKFSTEFTSWVRKINQNFEETRTAEGLLAIDFHEVNLLVVLIDLDEVNRYRLPVRFQQQIQTAFNGVRVVFLWQDIWDLHSAIVKSRIEAFLGLSRRIHGRQTSVIEMNSALAREFFNEHHMLGYTKAKYTYGLRHENDLVAAASFGRAVTVEREFGPSKSHEIIRFCYAKHVHVRGGLSKIVKHFIQAHRPGDIYTSVDMEWSDGSGYSTIGFEEIGRTEPLTFWIDAKGIRHRMEQAEAVKVTNAGNIKLMLVP